MGKVFANGLGDLGSIPYRVIPKTLKMVLDTSLLNTQQYKVYIRVKWRNPRKEVEPSPTPQCSSYWNGSLRIALDYCLPTLLTQITVKLITPPWFNVRYFLFVHTHGKDIPSAIYRFFSLLPIHHYSMEITWDKFKSACHFYQNASSRCCHRLKFPTASASSSSSFSSHQNISQYRNSSQ